MSNDSTPTIHVISKPRLPALEDLARERTEAVVGRFSERLDKVEVHLTDDNGPKGGCDQTCSIDVKLIPRGTLHVHATERDMQEAIQKAIHRLEKVVAKAVDKGHRGSAVRHNGGGLRGALKEWETP